MDDQQRTALVAVLMTLACAPQIAMGAAQMQPSTLQSQDQRTDRYYEQRRQLEPAAPAVDPVEAPLPAAATPVADGDVRFVLRDVRFSVSEFLSAGELDAVVAPWRGKEVDLGGIEQIVAAINQLYAERGITTARATLAGQAIRDGVVEIQLVEGRLGALTIEGAQHTRENFIRTRIRQQPGAVVDSDRLREDLVYLNRTTELQAQALLRPGSEVGQTDILLRATEPSRRYLDVFVDNAGVDSTGRERIGMQGVINGLAGINDQLTASFAYAKGGLEGRAAYSGIVNRRNGRIGLSYSRSQINIIAGAYRDLDITGESSAIALEFNQPFVATRTWLVNGVGSVSRSESSTDISDERIADNESTAVTVGASAARRGEGNEWSLTQLVSSVSADEPVLGKDRFTTAVGNFSGLRRLGQSRYLLRAGAGWQYSNDDALPSSNLFQIGGLGSVRGYERGILSGPRGYFVDIELHRAFGEAFDGYLFVDHGGVRGEYPRAANITGVGLGMAWRRNWLAASLDLGHPLDTVLAEQDSVRADFRVTVRWD